MQSRQLNSPEMKLICDSSVGFCSHCHVEHLSYYVAAVLASYVIDRTKKVRCTWSSCSIHRTSYSAPGWRVSPTHELEASVIPCISSGPHVQTAVSSSNCSFEFLKQCPNGLPPTVKRCTVQPLPPVAAQQIKPCGTPSRPKSQCCRTAELQTPRRLMQSAQKR